MRIGLRFALALSALVATAVASRAQSAGPSTIGPGDQLVATFTAAPNQADLLFFFNNDALTISGSPIFTTSLYDGSTLLGTYTRAPFVSSGSSSFVSAFASPGGGSGAAPYAPSTVDFSSIQGGSINGRLVTVVSGGSVSGFNLANAILYDAVSAGNGYQPQSDITLTSLTLQPAAGAPDVAYEQNVSFPIQTSDDSWTSSFSSNDGGFRAYDNFTLSATTTIQAVRWFGFYADSVTAANNPVSPDTTTWDISFYGDNDGFPGSQLYDSMLSAASVTTTFLGINMFNGVPVNVYQFDASLAGGFQATGGQQYWFSPFSIQSASFNPIMSWMHGTGGEGSTFQQMLNADGSISSTFTRAQDRAFTLFTDTTRICFVSSYSPFDIGPAGGSGNFTINFSAPGCAWNVFSDSPWLVFDPSSGTASGASISVPYTISPLATDAPRTAKVTIDPGTTFGAPFQFAEGQNSSNCTFSLTPGMLSIPASGGDSSPLTVSSSPSGCWWRPSFGGFLKSYSFSGFGPETPATFTFSADANSGPSRSTMVSSATDPPSSASVVVTQDGTSAALQVAPSTLSFAANAGGALPGPQSITVSSATGDPFPFAVAADDGFGRPAPAWLTISPASGTTPGLITVNANPMFLVAGNYSARIIVTVAGDAAQQPIYVAVMFTVAGAPPKLDVSPTFLSFRAIAQTPGTLQQTVLVRNTGGGGADAFSISLPNSINGHLSVAPANGQASPGNPVFVQVQLDTHGLAAGGYRGVIRFTSNDAVIDVAVSLFVANTGPILGVDQTGFHLSYRLMQGLAIPQTITVLNLGDPSSTVSFKAEFVNPTPWLTVSPTTGTATGSQPGAVTVTVVSSEADKLSVGSHYALIRISDPKSQNSTQYITAVLEVSTADASLPEPDPSPSGLVIVGTAGAPPPPAQQVQIYTSSSSPVSVQVSAPSANGSPFVTLGLSSGTLTTQTPAALSVSANTSQLSAGVYQGNITIAIGVVQRSVNITVIVVPAGSSSASRRSEPAAGCTPKQLVLTLFALTNTFSVKGGFPEPLSVIMNDDCGNLITNGQAVANFSNGDPALQLPGDGISNRYSATWQPVGVAQQMAITIQGSAGGLSPASAQITGGVNQNPNPAPVINQTVNQMYPAGGLSPGVIAQMYGVGLASTDAYTGVVPLPTAYKGTSVLIGNRRAPLFYISDGRVDIQIPSELAPGQYSILASNASGATSVQGTITLNAAAPGIATTADGQAIASNFAFVSSRNPAKPGDIMTVYLVGMGATKPAIASGHPTASTGPLPSVTIAPVVTLDGQKAKVLFAGLSTAGVGLYQIVFQIPFLARNGDLPLVVSQNGASANIASIAVER
jgi:uncharacterized protein (TIGR03437 family)